jgi:hypothetical protein
MTISTPRCKSITCWRLGTPPYTQTFLMPLLQPNLSHSTLICTASSRVGAITSTIGPSPGCKYGCFERKKEYKQAKTQREQVLVDTSRHGKRSIYSNNEVQ